MTDTKPEESKQSHARKMFYIGMSCIGLSFTAIQHFGEWMWMFVTIPLVAYAVVYWFVEWRHEY